MAYRFTPALLTLSLALSLAAAAMAQRRPTIAIMPAQYSQPDGQSAENVTRALVDRFQAQQYRVIPIEQSRALYERMGLSGRPNVSDAEMVRFGRHFGADLVARPQLFGVRHWEQQTTRAGEPAGARAVLYLRVLSARTGHPLYTSQVAYTFTTETPESGAPVLLPSDARAAADEVSRSYFQRVAGSREEIGRPARR